MISRVLSLFAQSLDISPLPFTDRKTDYAQSAWSNGLNIAFAIFGSVAVLMLIINGILYITANGDPQKMAAARHGIIYALIGLTVILLAATIVTFAVRGIG